LRDDNKWWGPPFATSGQSQKESGDLFKIPIAVAGSSGDPQADAGGFVVTGEQEQQGEK
jgi:predicted RNA-binding protein with TRAM domain